MPQKGGKMAEKTKEVSNLTPFQWLVTVFVGLSVAVSANKKILEAILVSVQNLAANSKQ